MSNHAETISVIVCAYTMDRWHDIEEAIDSLRTQVRKPTEILLIVDHNPQLLAAAAEAFPDVRVVPNRQARGLSGARNTGIDCAIGRFVAFLDDDAIADPHWLEALAQACNGRNVLGVTGRTSPLWIGVRPAWFPDEFLWVVGCSYRGLSRATRDEVRNVFGGAAMYPRALFADVGGFSARLGRTEGKSILLSCEETELCLRARSVFPNGTFVYSGDAAILHKVPASRLTWRYFFRRCYAEGFSKSVLRSLAGGAALATEQSYVLRTLTSGVLLGLGDTMFRFRWYGIARATAIVAGLTCASAGYAAAKLQLRQSAQRGDPDAIAAPNPGGKLPAKNLPAHIE